MAVLKDSGNRTEFGTGAVRDMGEGKGRFDLYPLSFIATCYSRNGKTLMAETIRSIDKFLYTLDTTHLHDAIENFLTIRGWTPEEMFIEVSKHFEDGAVKYGFHNWEKGINISSYISSGVRHLLQYHMGDKSDPHDRAFVWNLTCAIWTAENRPERIDTPYHTYNIKLYEQFKRATTTQCEGQMNINDVASSGQVLSTPAWNCAHSDNAIDTIATTGM